MSPIVYFKVELDNGLAGLFHSSSLEMSAIEIAKLKISQPELVVTQITESKYSELLNDVMPTTNDW